MRFIPFVTAILVTVTLYFLILERDKVMEFAGMSAAPAETVETTTEPTTAPVAETPEAPAHRPVSVFAVKSTAQAIPDIVLVRGRTEAARQVEARAETAGRVISDPLRKGAFVNADDVLCEIDPGTRAATLAQAEAALAEAKTRLPVAKANLSGAEAQLAEAQINFNATAKLKESGYATETKLAAVTAAVTAAEAGVESARSGLDSAQAATSTAEANVAAAKKEIDRLTISAPFAGLLETDTAEIGSLLQAGSLCATILQLDPIKLVGFVPETEVAKLSVGARAGARMTTGEEVQGRVTFLGRSADAATRTFRVEVDIPNPDLSIRDGQTVELVLSSGSTQAHLLPQSALTLDDEGHIGVRVVDVDSMATFLPVHVIRDTLDGIWVSGLPDQADVITIGQEYVINGVPVVADYAGLGQ